MMKVTQEELDENPKKWRKRRSKKQKKGWIMLRETTVYLLRKVDGQRIRITIERRFRT
jgi:hypothetical protein